MYASAVNSTHKSAQIKKHIVLCCNNYGFYANNIHRQAHTHIHKAEYKCKIENPPSVFVVVFFFIVFFCFVVAVSIANKNARASSFTTTKHASFRLNHDSNKKGTRTVKQTYISILKYSRIARVIAPCCDYRKSLVNCGVDSK